eukprot:PhF_6_TR31853/c0_g1_i1/m.47232/K00059/fabG; 3-oxoacyl-[acyl-carrier protein] reductase
MYQGLNVIVTGGSRGIGASIAQRFSAQGARVFSFSRTVPSPQPDNNNILYIPCDIRKEESCNESVKSILDQCDGHIDILINNAGIENSGIFARCSSDTIDEVINTNIKGTMFMTKAVLKDSMLKRKMGSIVNIGSVIGTEGNAGQAVYAASKSSLVGFTKSLAEEYGKYNIRFNLVVPGFVETDMTKKLPPKVVEDFVQRTALKRMGKPDEVADVVCFVSRATYMTGQIVGVDGG